MVKRWVTVQSCNLGIQATEEAKTTHAQTTRNLPSRGSKEGGSGQIQPCKTTSQQRKRGEEPGGSRGQRERDTPAPEGIQTCLSGVQKRGQGSYYDEYLSEGAQSTPTTQETWCRGKEPHTGPMAFSAMRHNEEGKSMHNNHSKHRGKATRPSPEATIPRGRDQ